jgi:hypothetical protein
MPRPARISFANLPPRPHQLTESELSRVFGGCKGTQESCNEDKDCCYGYGCYKKPEFDNRPLCLLPIH